jgi:hypothetical protein
MVRVQSRLRKSTIADTTIRGPSISYGDLAYHRATSYMYIGEKMVFCPDCSVRIGDHSGAVQKHWTTKPSSGESPPHYFTTRSVTHLDANENSRQHSVPLSMRVGRTVSPVNFEMAFTQKRNAK